MPRIKKPKKVKEPIRLRMKDLSDGSKSLYLDIYRNGKRTYEYLKLYLIPGTDNNTRRQNEITMAAANAIKSKRIIELTSGEAGIVNHTDKVYLLDWMQTYLEYQEKRDKKGIGQIKAVTHILKEYAGERFLLDRVDLAFCQGYIDYMLTTFRPKGKPIAASTRNT
ncbi:Arm DNA-binding domain-containing protein, partial [Phocaeicola vulgatus]|nr:Arm DNA-binding domain-containing protein [Phocaeicola vulgatus]